MLLKLKISVPNFMWNKSEYMYYFLMTFFFLNSSPQKIMNKTET